MRRRVRAFAAGWTGDLDVLINNAGIMAATPLDRHIGGFQGALIRSGYRFIAQKRV